MNAITTQLQTRNRNGQTGFHRAAIIAGLLAATACGGDVDTETGDFVDTVFAPASVDMQLQDDGTHQLMLGGDADGQAATLYIDVNRVDFAAGTTLEITGETFFDGAAQGQFLSNPENNFAIGRAFVMGGCPTCSTGPTWQSVNGTLRIDEVTADTLTGHIDITMEGDVPNSSLRNIRTTVSGPFRANIPVMAPVVTAPTTPDAEPSVGEPTPPANPGPSTQPNPEGPLATPASDTFEVTLTANWGVNLATGDLVSKANFKNSDLYATAGNPWLKLTPGGSTSSKVQPMRWFTQSGLIQTFDSLATVPLELPTDDDGSKSLVHAKPYVGFVVRANLSNLSARVWIKSADENHVTIEWQHITAAE
jgi:hypothetical protein